MDLENPELLHWLDGIVQCWGVSPDYKRELILDYARRLGLTTLIETGTWHGDTVEYVRQHFNQVHSIELSSELFAANKSKFQSVANVQLYLGDSGEVLREILSRLPKTPTLFWLDAHSSGGDTVGVGTPLEKELLAIFENVENGAVLIDDLQEFWGHGWGDLARKTVAKYSGWQQEIKFGIMRVTRVR